MRPFLTAISEGQALSRHEAEDAMHLLMRGETTEIETAAFLLGLRSRGETIEELTGFTHVMREYAIPVQVNDPNTIDVCGTGGDRSGTFNVSTTVAFVCAGAGVTVAKHGNRSVSSQSGSADVLEALGVKSELGKEAVEVCLDEVGIAFIFAPLFHPALRHVMPVRRALGVRTFFNILGPLCNPARVKRQLVGAFSKEVAHTMTEVLARLGSENVIAVHAHDGLDEFSTSTATDVFGYTTKQNLWHKTVIPEQFGLRRVDPVQLKGGNATENARILKAILSGEKGPHREIVLLNAAYALFVSGQVGDLEQAFVAAKTSIDSGAAQAKLSALIRASHLVNPD